MLLLLLIMPYVCFLLLLGRVSNDSRYTLFRVKLSPIHPSEKRKQKVTCLFLSTTRCWLMSREHTYTAYVVCGTKTFFPWVSCATKRPHCGITACIAYHRSQRIVSKYLRTNMLFYLPIFIDIYIKDIFCLREKLFIRFLTAQYIR